MKQNKGWYKKGRLSEKKGKTFEEIYGEEKAKNIKEKISKFNKGKISVMKGNPIAVECGKKLQRIFWKDKDELRAQVGMLGYLKVLEKYGKEHFLKLPTLVKYPNEYELKIKTLLEHNNIVFAYQFRKDNCIPDFYIRKKYLIEVTNLYPLRKDERTLQKIIQLKKYLNNFNESLILVTIFVNEWLRILEEYNLENNIKVCSENKLIGVITK